MSYRERSLSMAVSIATVAGAVALTTLASAASPAEDLGTSVGVVGKVEAAVRQSIAGLEAVPAAWDRTTNRFSRFIGDLQGTGGAVDPNALVQEVLKQSYEQTTEDLRFYADKVKYYNEQKKALRDSLAPLRDAEARVRAAAGRTATDLRVAGLEQAVRGLDAYDQGLERIRGNLARRAARLQGLKPNDANINKTLTTALQDSIKDMNEDKKYVVKQIADMNKAASAVGAQQKKLADASAKLADEEKKKVKPR
jgi:uncharacterized phage infection (PIP) family protein YhgE